MMTSQISSLKENQEKEEPEKKLNFSKNWIIDQLSRAKHNKETKLTPSSSNNKKESNQT